MFRKSPEHPQIDLLSSARRQAIRYANLNEIHVNDGSSNHFQDLCLSWDQNRVTITPDEVVDELSKGTPLILVSARGDSLGIAVSMMKPEQVNVVAMRVKDVFEEAV